jgi:hypothetical protein
LGHVFIGKAFPSAGLQHTEQMEHVSRPYLPQTPDVGLVMEWSYVIASTHIIPLKTCSVCSMTPNAAPMAGVEVNTY